MSDLHGPNHLLRQARLRPPSPSAGPMSQRELAEAVTAYIQRTTGRDVALDRHYISRLERGVRGWPNADYRAGFRAVLGAETDAELGFVRTLRAADHVVDKSIPEAAMLLQLVVTPGVAVIVVPGSHPVLLALVGREEPGA